MAEAILSVAAQRVVDLIELQGRFHVNLVRGAEKEVHNLAEELQTIQEVLDDADNRRFHDKRINQWLSRLEQTSYQMEDVLDEWDYALLKLQFSNSAPPKQKVGSFIPIPSCVCFKKISVRHKIATKILNVKAQLDKILKEKDRYSFLISQPKADPLPGSRRIESTSLIDPGKVQGRDRDRDFLVSKLMDNSCSQSSIQIVSIVGVGGLGKTTLAQLVYNDSRVEKSFELRIWICVSDLFDLSVIAKGVLESVKVGSSPNTNQLDVLFKQVKESISGKTFLLVLDDVWTTDSSKLEPLENSLQCGGAGSKILVTTRNERVVKIMGSRDSKICRLGLLSDEDIWLLLCRIALSGRNEVEFEDIGKKIAKKCNGLPLATKTLGSLLRFKSKLDEWKNVLNSDIWKMEEAEVEIFPHLLLSYKELSTTLKRCFSYCAIFPKDSNIFVDNVIGDWMALGYLGSNTGDMELKGRECFDTLAIRSLLQIFEKYDFDEIRTFKMHDIVHDFAQFIRKSGKVEPMPARMNKTTCKVCDPLLVSTVNQFCSLYWENETPLILCDCLVRLRVLSLTYRGLQSIPLGLENLIHLRKLRLVGIHKLSCEEFKIISQLYYLQTLILERCNIIEIPKEIENLINLRRLVMSHNKSLKELPREIGKLIHLRYLDLSHNKCLKELPRKIGKLIYLKLLDLSWNVSLRELPESICGLQELEILITDNCQSLCILPEGLAQLTGLRSLTEYRGGTGWSKLGLLMNLNHLSGTLCLNIRLACNDDFEEVVEDARKAGLRNKAHIEELKFTFEDEIDEDELSSWVSMKVIEALEPHPNLQTLFITNYNGFAFPLGWMVSPLNQLHNLYLNTCCQLTSLPCLAKLPFLEVIFMHDMEALQSVGRDFLGITSGDILNITAFPKLKNLSFVLCDSWKEWEDITAEEEECTTFSVMPCLTKLHIGGCSSLTALPHRLLCKASSLEMLQILDSEVLRQRYRKKDGSDLRFIFQNNPQFQLSFD